MFQQPKQDNHHHQVIIVVMFISITKTTIELTIDDFWRVVVFAHSPNQIEQLRLEHSQSLGTQFMNSIYEWPLNQIVQSTLEGPQAHFYLLLHPSSVAEAVSVNNTSISCL